MRVLFFSPKGDFNGAEMMLANLLKYADKTSLQGEIFIFEKGKVFDSVGFPVHQAPEQTFQNRLLNRFASRAGFSSLLERKISSLHHRFKPDLWYINTINTPYIIPLALKLGVAYAVHFHELPYYYFYAHTSETMKTLVTRAAFLLGCSNLASENIKLMGGANVEKQYECIDTQTISTSAVKRRLIREQLSIPADAFLWAMSGLAYYRKGADFLPAIFEQLKDENTHLIWIGGFGETGYNYFVREAIRTKGLHTIHFVGSQSEDYYDYLDAADGFLLTSREDPFPLVMIEAAALGKPIVAFNSGGVSEFVTEGMGTVVDTMKTDDLVSAMRKVMRGDVYLNSELSKKRAREFDAQPQTLKWQQILSKYVR